MVKNVTYHNRINQEENTPLVTILETRIDLKQSTAVDSRRTKYVVDLSKASFGGVSYPEPGSQWYLKKISSVWTLMARAPQQNPQLDPSFEPQPGDTYTGDTGTTYVVGDLVVLGSIAQIINVIYPVGTIYLTDDGGFTPEDAGWPGTWVSDSVVNGHDAWKRTA